MSPRRLWLELTARLEGTGRYLSFLFLRLVLAWEFWEAGWSKLQGENWFSGIPWQPWQQGFPFPVNLLPDEVNWYLALGAELLFSLMLLLGLGTRFAALGLLVLDSIAIAAVHWPAEWGNLAQLAQGYVITAGDYGNYKLPLVFAVMLLPLIFHGGGKFSLDHWILDRMIGRKPHPREDRPAWGLAAMILGLFLVFLLPWLGVVLLAFSLLTFWPWLIRSSRTRI